MSAGSWEVLDAGALVLVQDAGRPGLAHLGVPRAGWLDADAASLANRLVGNTADEAVLEVAGGGLRVRQGQADRWVAVTGARCAVDVDGAAMPHGEPVRLRAGSVLTLDAAVAGVRSYLAVAGGVAVDPVLGSRSTDTLAWVGPPPVRTGAVVPLGTSYGAPRPVDVTARPAWDGVLRVWPGPRAAWVGEALERLCATGYLVSAASNRVGLRLEGHPLRRERTDELPSEGLVVGSVQVPPDGRPVVFLADHPTTGGYPVVALVDPGDLARCAQLGPGDAVRFRRVRSP